MKHRLFALLPIAAMLLASCNNTRNTDTPQLLSREDTLSWAMGENLALSVMETQGTLHLNKEVVKQALNHTLEGKSQPIDDRTLRDAISYIIYQQQAEAIERNRQTGAQVDQQQEEYFAQLVKEHPSVKRHESGFYYEELKAGKGRKAQYGDRIKFDYRSYLMLTGEPYDQTYGKREPIIHVVGKPMFQGLIDGIQLMNAGSIYRFYFPYQLAFGQQGSGDIPGSTPFIYEIELHEIFDF